MTVHQKQNVRKMITLIQWFLWEGKELKKKEEISLILSILFVRLFKL